MKLKFLIFKPLIIAFLIFLGIEFITFLKLGKTKINEALIENTFFDNKFKKLDVGQKYMILYKSQIFKNNNAEFLQVGDSSGFFGIRPNIVNNYLQGMDYLNLSCCADSGWDGYVYTANYYLKNNPNAKYLVLYTSPYSLPMQYKKGFSEDLQNIFGDFKDKNFFKAFNYIPSIFYRKKVLNILYQNKIEDKGQEYKRAMDNLGIAENFFSYTGYKNEQLLEYLNYSKGWLPYSRKDGWNNMPVNNCGNSLLKNFYDVHGKPTLNNYLEKVKRISDRYGVKLVVIFNPVACKDSEKIEPIHKDLKKFRLSNPGVYIPFEFVTSIDKEEFSDRWHLTPKASINHSHKIGKVLEDFLKANKNNNEVPQEFN